MPDAHVNSTGGLTNALANSAIGRIVLMPGTYELDANTNSTCSGNQSTATWFCIDRAVKIEAAEAGTVELNAREQRRIFYITGTGVELIGLDITGGIAVPMENVDVGGHTYSDGVVGGGLFIQGGEAALVNCNIFGNRASGNTSRPNDTANGNGGGLFVAASPSGSPGRVALVGCNVSHNNASDGGGLCIADGSTANLTECSIFGNVANIAGFGFGGGLRVDGNCTMTLCNIHGNSALKLGGGLALSDGSHATLDGCTIAMNSARDGGGVSASPGVLHMIDCVLLSNGASESNFEEADPDHVGGWGGTCTCGDGETYAVGDNNDGCGSLACVGGTSGVCRKHEPGTYNGTGVRVTCGRGRGGGIFAGSDSHVSCTRCTLINNVASTGGGLLIAGTTSATFQTSYFQLNRAEGGDGGAIDVVQEGELRLYSSEFEGNTGSSFSASAIFYQSTGSSLIVDCTFRNHSDAAALVISETPLSWKCQLGQWSPQIGRIDAADFSGCALKCPVGTVGLSADLTSSAACSACPIGLSTDAEGARSVSECTCPVGFYIHTPSNCSAADVGSGPELLQCVTEWKCEECPERADCNTPNAALAQLDVDAGYWRQSEFSSEIRRCDNPAACLGGSNVSSQCADGHQGPYCDVCLPHYFGGRHGQLCTSCEGAGSMLLYIPLLAALLALLGILVYCLCLYARAQARGDVASASVEDTKTNRRCLSSKAYAIKIKLRILISSWQVLGSLDVVFRITRPRWYEDAIDGLSALQMDSSRLLPLRCRWPVAFDVLLVLRTLLPLALMGLVVGIGRLARNKSDWKAASERCPVICFYVLFLIYPSCCSAIFSFFACDSLPDQSRYLHADYSIDCDSAAYRGMRVYALVMVLVYPIGTPLLFYILLRREQSLIDRISRHEYTAHAQRQLEEKRGAEKMSRRRRLDTFSQRNTVSVAFLAPPELRDSGVSKEDKPEWHDAEVQRLRQKLSLFVKLLTNSYEMRCAKFEVFECVRKILLVGMPVLFEQPGSDAQFMFGMLVCFISFGVYACWMPYRDHDDDQLQAAAQLQIFFGLLSKVAYDDSNSDDTTLTIALVGLLLAPPLLAGLQVSGLHTKLKKLLAHLTYKASSLCSVPLFPRAQDELRSARRSTALTEAQRSGGEVGRQRQPLRALMHLRLRKRSSSFKEASPGHELEAVHEGPPELVTSSSRKQAPASSIASEGASPAVPSLAIAAFQVAPDI